MDLVFIKIKDDEGDVDLLNVHEITDIQPCERGTTDISPFNRDKAMWRITMTNEDEYVVSDEIINRVFCAIRECGIIVDCTGNRERSYVTSDKKKNAVSPRNITFD